ncbi:phosphoribosylanthranilate isomerase [Silvimonas iriomotensis]|uniref:N-(5'-phosphoribosyl)anthranilate isomerase n=1 Tax=Silvimonas iriomotensis TaxID=449662 RepID=A0ABQ2P5Q0_9NEIS|nr:phosphoribosylanthranilate isomerase [Silvimonas iriomotensis]GGP18643.1 N-(5'-phosphoribosyl)anthranilate isomerase [Silvimonas iriomotensis]
MNQQVRIKICGLRDPATARAAAQMGADAIGLVFYEPSPRNVSVEEAKAVLAALPAFVTSVGLFVNADPDWLRDLLQVLPLDLLQFHGDESPEYCRSFGKPWIKAVRVKQDTNLIEYAAQFHDARGLLVDAFVEGTPGGTGEAFDWSLIPEDLPLPLILSGGLNPGNVSEAVAAVAPWAVDVSSGVESTRGVKDLNKVAQFIKAARHA